MANKVELLSKEDYNSPLNQNRDNPIVGFKSLTDDRDRANLKSIEINITGSGTINQVAIRLNDIVRHLLNTPEDVEEGIIEDEILLTKIEINY